MNYTRNIKKHLRVISFSAGLISLIMFYMIGGWKLPLAMILFGWSMNLDNSTKE